MNAYIYTSMCAFCVGDEPYPPLITCVYLHTQPMRKLVTEGDPRPGVTSEEVFFKVVVIMASEVISKGKEKDGERVNPLERR